MEEPAMTPPIWCKRLATALPVLFLLDTACDTAPSRPPGPLDSLIAAAKAEGVLNLMTVLPDWCNYGELMATFKQRYGIAITSLNPTGSSQDEVNALLANQSGDLTIHPDVLDMGLAFGPSSKQADLLLPYKVSTWDTIPDAAKDADGAWYGSYYGVMALEVNTAVVRNPPKEWADLLKPEYKGQVALAGDPRKSGQAINSVYAVALGMGGTLADAQPGLSFFDQLNKAGNFLPVIADQRSIAGGQTPIVLRWDFNALTDRAKLDGTPPISINVPTKGVLAGISIQAISKFAAHPNAAKLWEELLYSDEGQLMWLKGYCHPIRYKDLLARSVIPADLTDKLPPAAIYATAQFPPLEQLSRAQTLITVKWDGVVGVDVK
jgi:putative spermidine/putrescine transport system substrate-binding protein